MGEGVTVPERGGGLYWMRMVVAGSGMANFHNVRRLPTWAILTKLSFVVRVGESIHALV